MNPSTFRLLLKKLPFVFHPRHELLEGWLFPQPGQHRVVLAYIRVVDEAVVNGRFQPGHGFLMIAEHHVQVRDDGAYEGVVLRALTGLARRFFIQPMPLTLPDSSSTRCTR